MGRFHEYFLKECNGLISSTIQYNLGSHLRESVLCHEEKYLESGD